MATYDWYKTHQPNFTSLKPGSNWLCFRINWREQQMAQNDSIRLCEIKDHWILKCGFTRSTIATTGAAALDMGILLAGQEVDTAMACDSGTDTWLAIDGATDDAPVAIIVDGYIYIKVIDAAVTDGITDIMLEFVIPAWDTETDSLAE